MEFAINDPKPVYRLLDMMTAPEIRELRERLFAGKYDSSCYWDKITDSGNLLGHFCSIIHDTKNKALITAFILDDFPMTDYEMRHFISSHPSRIEVGMTPQTSKFLEELTDIINNYLYEAECAFILKLPITDDGKG
jgi:hypothetical protein